MADHGNAFGVDLYQLEQVATSDLPTVSGGYDDAIGNCHGADKARDGMTKSLAETARLYADNDRAAATKSHQLLDDRGTPKPE